MDYKNSFIPNEVKQWLALKGLQQPQTWNKMKATEQQLILYQMSTIFGWKYVINFCVQQQASMTDN